MKVSIESVAILAAALVAVAPATPNISAVLPTASRALCTLIQIWRTEKLEKRRPMCLKWMNCSREHCISSDLFHASILLLSMQSTVQQLSMLLYI